MNEPKRRGSCISNPKDKTKIQTEDLQKQNKPQTPSLLPNTEQEQDQGMVAKINNQKLNPITLTNFQEQIQNTGRSDPKHPQNPKT